MAGLEHELEVIQEPAFIAQQARGYGLGGPREIPFSLGPGASPLPSDAPGSPRCGSVPRPRSARWSGG